MTDTRYTQCVSRIIERRTWESLDSWMTVRRNLQRENPPFAKRNKTRNVSRTRWLQLWRIREDPVVGTNRRYRFRFWRKYLAQCAMTISWVYFPAWEIRSVEEYPSRRIRAHNGNRDTSLNAVDNATGISSRKKTVALYPLCSVSSSWITRLSRKPLHPVWNEMYARVYWI